MFCKRFRSNLWNNLAFCWSFSYCFFYLIYFCIIISYNNLLLIVNPHAIQLDIGMAIKPIPVRLNVIELDVVVITTIVSNDFNIIDNVLCFYISVLICYFYL